jgi:hypothetical protein
MSRPGLRVKHGSTAQADFTKVRYTLAVLDPGKSTEDCTPMPEGTRT